MEGRGAVASLLLAGTLALACGGAPEGEARATLPDSTYVEVMARLVLLDSTMASPSRPPSPAAADSARRLILERYGVDASGVLAFARERGSDPEAMWALWQRVQELSDSLRESGWEPPTGKPSPDPRGPGSSETAGASGGT